MILGKPNALLVAVAAVALCGVLTCSASEAGEKEAQGSVSRLEDLHIDSLHLNMADQSLYASYSCRFDWNYPEYQDKVERVFVCVSHAEPGTTAVTLGGDVPYAGGWNAFSWICNCHARKLYLMENVGLHCIVRVYGTGSDSLPSMGVWWERGNSDVRFDLPSYMMMSGRNVDTRKVGEFLVSTCLDPSTGVVTRRRTHMTIKAGDFPCDYISWDVLMPAWNEPRAIVRIWPKINVIPGRYSMATLVGHLKKIGFAIEPFDYKKSKEWTRDEAMPLFEEAERASAELKASDPLFGLIKGAFDAEMMPEKKRAQGAR